MTIKLGSNQLSFAVQARLNDASAAVSSSSQRLSSGMRINKASDDAAGLAISSSLNLKSRVFTQGIRNLNDGLSAVNIAESAIGSLSEILVQIEELSVQAMNGTYSDVQRQSMQQQVDALQAEWNRLVEGTTFNGQQLLTGFGTRMLLQGSEGVDGALAVQVGEELLSGGFADNAGGTTRVSTTSAGAQGAGIAKLGAISADGRYVAFDSWASNLVNNAGIQDSFIKDTLTGVTTRISTSSSGVAGNGGNFARAISADGRYVAFDSNANNLVSGDTNGSQDSFVKDTLTGETTRVNTNSLGAQSGTFAYVRAISGDGRYVAFESAASDLVSGDSNGTRDAFVKDMLTGLTTRVSTSSSGGEANGISDPRAISADGRYVAFYSTATNLVASDTNGSLRDSFIKDTITGVTTLVSTNSSGVQGNSSSYVRAMSADARYVAFDSSSTNLVSGDSNSRRDAFVKDVLTGVTRLVSSNSSGGQGNGDSFVRSISDDGRYVVFDSASSDLVAGDSNGQYDTFVKDMITGITTRVNVHTDGTQSNGTMGGTASISADGRFVAFDSYATSLVAGDTNATRDVFVRDLTKMGVQALAGMVVNNRVSASLTLNLVAKYKQELTEYKSTLGASTARISSFISTLDSSRTNYVQAASRITDTDIAEESASLVAATTRQRVATALLAQAKIAPQIALNLLRGV